MQSSPMIKLEDAPPQLRVCPALTKVLCFVPCLGNGGAEMHLLRLLKHFDRTEFQPILAVTRAGGSYESRLPEDVNLHKCGWGKLPSETLRVQSAIRPLRRLLLRERPDVVLTLLDHAVAAMARALEDLPFRKPLFIACLQNNLQETLRELPLWTKKWLRRRIVSGYARADHVIALSEGAAQALLKSVPWVRRRFSVIYNAGYDENVEELAREEPALALPAGPLFLGCGRLTQQKDFLTLVQAFARIHGETGGELWILGEGEMRKTLEREVAALGLQGSVRLPGFVANPFAFMARASAFILCSQWEGFGNVLTEAMACGTPVISTDCPHGPREILEEGKWGELVPVGDVAALGEAMRRSLREKTLFQARAAAAREQLVRFEATEITQAYENLLRRALKAKFGRSS